MSRRAARLLRRVAPDTIGGQVALLLVACVLAMNVAATTAFLLDRRETPRRPPADVSGELALAIRTLAALDPPARPAGVAAINAAAHGFTLRLADGAEPADAAAPPPDPGNGASLLARELPPGSVVRRLPPGGDGTGPDGGGATHLVGLADGTRIVAAVEPRAFPFLLGPGLFTLVFLALGLLLFGTWSVRLLTAPLRRFAGAVEAFGGAAASPELAEAGPREVRAAIGAFNRMQRRIGRLIDDNARMLAAVSHDLRTPITRLRLRAEFIDDAEMRAAMLADLDHVAALTADALAWLDGARAGPPLVRVDLASLVEATVDQFADLGRPVRYDGPERLAARARPDDLARALRNLIENGLTYAGDVAVTLAADPSGVARIAVLDDGPGIAPADRERLQRPFERGDAARTQDGRSGFGLGLSIARAVAEAHGGRLELGDRDPHGLAAVIVLPLDPRPLAAP